MMWVLVSLVVFPFSSKSPTKTLSSRNQILHDRDWSKTIEYSIEGLPWSTTFNKKPLSSCSTFPTFSGNIESGSREMSSVIFWKVSSALACVSAASASSFRRTWIFSPLPVSKCTRFSTAVNFVGRGVKELKTDGMASAFKFRSPWLKLLKASFF